MTPETRKGQLLRWEACHNLRDLGGYESAYGRTRSGAVLRGDNLSRLTDVGQAELVRFGVRTVIDLRADHEIATAAHPFAAGAGEVTYLNLPLLDDADFRDDGMVRLAASPPALYAAMLEQRADRMAGVVRAIARARPGGVLFHCHAGKDRTGLIAMFLLTLAGVPRDTIVADYALSTENLAVVHAEILDRFEDPAERASVARHLHSEPEYMVATLDMLESRYGGPAAYLSAAGLSDEDAARIRGLLLEP